LLGEDFINMSKRIRNYRTGDRAEDLGIFLLKAFCAVAPIPRQEDFGLADGVATLLRSDGRFWYAEDSFLIQLKSRTEKELTLEGPVFERWLAQDLSILVGRVNLINSSIELFTLGIALFDRRVHEATSLVVWMIDGEDGIRDGVLHLKLSKPILQLSAADTENSEFTDRAYGTLKKWLRLERWNRRYFRAGVAREILWETNAMPEAGGVVHTWTPAHGLEALEDIEPLVHLLGLHSRHHPELWARVHEVEAALRGADDRSITAGMQSFMRMTDDLSRLAAILMRHPTADVVATIQIPSWDAERANFWIHLYGRGKAGNSQRHEGTWEELKQKGFHFVIEGDGPNAKLTPDLARYFASTPVAFEIIEGPKTKVTLRPGDHSPPIFLRRLPPKTADEAGGNAEGGPAQN
jgi:hypothetical protein